MYHALLHAALFVALGAAQQIGTQKPENHPALPIQQCFGKVGCRGVKTSVTLDASYRWLHTADEKQCYNGDAGSGGSFNTTVCPDAETCAKSCAVDGTDYSSNGVSTKGNSLSLSLYANNTKSSPRVYLLEDETTYRQFKLLGKEFSFDVDVSKAGCGVNGALYMTEMDPKGSLTANNVAGAKYGTGYCDAQCAKGKFVLGQPALDNSTGACCAEIDIWEANSQATALTAHPCQKPGRHSCSGPECNDQCDSSGCDFNPFRLGARDFFGPNKQVDTTRPFTVITQFITADGTANTALTAIKRLYQQNGRIVDNAQISLSNLQTNSLTEGFCKTESFAFNEGTSYQFDRMGGFDAMSAALKRGMVLSLSIWDDTASHLQWLDGTPGGSSAPQKRSAGVVKRQDIPYVRGSGIPYRRSFATSKWTRDVGVVGAGNLRGPCDPNGGGDGSISKDSAVVFSNIKVGDINATFTTSGKYGTMPIGSTPTPGATWKNLPTKAPGRSCRRRARKAAT